MNYLNNQAKLLSGHIIRQGSSEEREVIQPVSCAGAVASDANSDEGSRTSCQPSIQYIVSEACLFESSASFF